MANIEKRLNQGGELSYRAKVRLKGMPAQSATFKRLTDAKKWVQDTESAIRDGRYFRLSEAKKHSFAELIDRYIRDVLPNKPKSLIDQKRQLEWWKKELGSFLLADITPALIAERRDLLGSRNTVRGTRRSPSTVNRYLAALSHAFTIAMKEWGWLDDNPLRKVSRPKEPRGRVRFLSEAERPVLLAACKTSKDPYLYLVVVLALSTGARKSELLNLRWEDIDFSRKLIILHETKNGDRRLLPMVGHALELMKEHANHCKAKSVLVFPDKNSLAPADIRIAWEAALKQANIENFRFHDLRHSAASYLAMNGASTAEIAEVLGHKTLQMVKRYSHLSEAHTTDVVARMNNKIFGEVHELYNTR